MRVSNRSHGAHRWLFRGLIGAQSDRRLAVIEVAVSRGSELGCKTFSIRGSFMPAASKTTQEDMGQKTIPALFIFSILSVGFDRFHQFLNFSINLSSDRVFYDIKKGLFRNTNLSLHN